MLNYLLKYTFYNKNQREMYAFLAPPTFESTNQGWNHFLSEELPGCVIKRERERCLISLSLFRADSPGREAYGQKHKNIHWIWQQKNIKTHPEWLSNTLKRGGMTVRSVVLSFGDLLHSFSCSSSFCLRHMKSTNRCCEQRDWLEHMSHGSVEVKGCLSWHPVARDDRISFRALRVCLKARHNWYRTTWKPNVFLFSFRCS